MIREYSNTVEEKLLQLERRLDKQREEHEKQIDALLLVLEALWQEKHCWVPRLKNIIGCLFKTLVLCIVLKMV